MRCLATLIVTVLSLTTVSRASEQDHEGLLNAFKRHSFSQVIASLKQLETAEPEKFAVNNYQYLLARAYESNGDIANAAISYQGIVRSDSVLREYALWRLSQIARFSGEPFLERAYLLELASYFPDSLLLNAANHRIANSFFEAKNYDQAINFLTRPTAATLRARKPAVPDPLLRQDLALLANAYLFSGDSRRARELFDRLVSETPDARQPDDIALVGVRGLDMLDTAAGASSSELRLSAGERFRRAQVYQFNRKFAEARAHFIAIVEQFPDDPAVADSTYQIARGYVALELFAEAVPWFERVLEQFPLHPIAKDALLQAGSAYTRLGKHREGISRYREYIDRYPEDERLDRAYLNIIDIFRDSGEETAALRQAAAAQDVFRGKTGEAQALFAEAKVHISVDDWEKGLEALDRLVKLPDLGGTRVPGGTSKQEVEFLRGYLLEQLRRYPEAITAYLSIPDGRNEYYGWRATERLRQLYDNELSAASVAAELTKLAVGAESADLESVRRSLQSALRLLPENDANTGRLLDALRLVYTRIPAYAELPTATTQVSVARRKIRDAPVTNTGAERHRDIAEELVFLGLYDEAAPELEAAGELKDIDGTAKLARVYTFGDIAHRGVAFAEPLWSNVPSDYAIDLIPVDTSALLYPAPYRTDVRQNAAERSFDPRLLFAVMRQESRFRADVKSYAAARGLMQFIPQTSDQIARDLGLNDFEQDDLFDPAVGVRFGAQYIGNLFQLFPNQPDSVVAGYNGGESNVRRWLKRANSNAPERFVPEIAYSQTKDYVHKVMANYRMYVTLYDREVDQVTR